MSNLICVVELCVRETRVSCSPFKGCLTVVSSNVFGRAQMSLGTKPTFSVMQRFRSISVMGSWGTKQIHQTANIHCQWRITRLHRIFRIKIAPLKYQEMSGRYCVSIFVYMQFELVSIYRVTLASFLSLNVVS